MNYPLARAKSFWGPTIEHRSDRKVGMLQGSYLQMFHWSRTRSKSILRCIWCSDKSDKFHDWVSWDDQPLCSCAARRWGYTDVWLQTDASNLSAQRLYKVCGYQEEKRDPSFYGPFRKVLLRKSLQPIQGHCFVDSEHEPEIGNSKSSRGTYKWNVS